MEPTYLQNTTGPSGSTKLSTGESAAADRQVSSASLSNLSAGSGLKKPNYFQTKKFKIFLFLFSLFSIISYSQDCGDYYNYHKWVNCTKTIKRNYKIYTQPKNTRIGINDTLTYNIVFNGNRDYIISFCADQIYYPISIRLLQPETGIELYDNATDDYVSSIGVGFYKTQNLLIVITSMADKLAKDKIKGDDGTCVGMIMQWKKIFNKIE